jgi:uncharacterized iron-regulated protein
MSVPGKKFLLLVTAALFVTACDLAGSRIIRVSDGATVSFDDMVEDFTTVPLVFIGELHNHPEHHRAQLRVIEALLERGSEVAIGLEMFHDGHQGELDSWVSGRLGREEFLEIYYHNWSSPWPLYRDIFQLAREKELPMVALNASPDLTGQVAAHGFSSLAPSQLARLPGVSCVVDPEYEKFIRQALGAHPHGAGSFRTFCEAQMVWDTTMAWRVTEYLDRYPGATMVVLAGSGHSWKRGIPEQVDRLSELTYLTLLPEMGESLTRENVSEGDTDYLWTGL